MGCDIHLYIEYTKRNGAKQSARTTLTDAEIEELRMSRFSVDPEAARRVARLIDEVTEHRKTSAEKSEEDTRYWMPFGGRINPGRNYELFGRLAGVREENRPHIPPRGLPKNLGWEASTDAFLYVREDDAKCDGDCDHSCTQTQAKEWGNDWTDKDKRYVHAPDWHTHSWLTFEEFCDALNATEYVDAGYQAVRAAMQTLEYEGYDTRVVFWFDN